MKTAVIILGHGSKTARATDAVLRVVSDVKKLGGFEIVEQAFLQYVSPDLLETIGSCARRGAEQITVVPFFMQMGSHVVSDIPKLIEKAKKRHPDIELAVTDYAGAHPLMAKIVVDLVVKSNAECGMRNAE